jgi:ankyrin repeat protein
MVATYARNADSSFKELNNRVLKFFMLSCRPQFMSWQQVICSGPVLKRQDLKRTGIERRKRGLSYYPRRATSLYYAASFGIEHVVRALLEQGAEVDARGGRLEATAFHAAALQGHIEIMDILYQKGADPNKMDRVRKTALHSATLVNDVEVIKYLLEHRADPDIEDDQRRTVYSWACILGLVEAQKLLKQVKGGNGSDKDAAKISSSG